STARELYLDAPAALTQTRTVQMLSAGTFAGLAQIIVEVRERPAAASTQFAFIRPGEQHTWEPATPGGDLAYQVRRTLVFQDGHNEAEPQWSDDSRTVLIVQDPAQFTVRVEPRLLDLGGATRLALLHLEPVNAPAGDPARATFALRNPAEAVTWTFRTPAPDRHGYRFRLDLVPAAGPRTETDWQQAESEVLVLRLPGAR